MTIRSTPMPTHPLAQKVLAAGLDSIMEQVRLTADRVEEIRWLMEQGNITPLEAVHLIETNASLLGLDATSMLDDVWDTQNVAHAGLFGSHA